MSASVVDYAASQCVWNEKYRLQRHGRFIETSVVDTLRRVARALAVNETNPDSRYTEFLQVMEDLRFIPGGRILASAGTALPATLFNCFVMGRIDNSLSGILDAMKETALTLETGGGAGLDFSTLRPAGEAGLSNDNQSAGPVACLRLWDSMADALKLGGSRHSAMMATLRTDHPDVEAFVNAKQWPGALRHFNLSVLASDAFMSAIANDEPWPLIFPLSHADPPTAAAQIEREWPGCGQPIRCREYRRIPARTLWHAILKAAFEGAEPGILFIDRLQRQDNLGYAEQIVTTNPCGEVPLPAYGACNLGSVNLPRFVRNPFEQCACIDFDALAATVRTAVRMLDNVYDLSLFPLPMQAETARLSRRLSLGIMGLGDALVMLGIPYASTHGIALASEVMQTILHAAYRASVQLAQERGAFPHFQRDAYLAAPFIASLPAHIRDAIAAHGIRNSHLTAIAPTGSISLFANAVSSGMEPLFAPRYRRQIGLRDGGTQDVDIEAYSLRVWKAAGGDAARAPVIPQADEIAPQAQIAMQAALQRFVDNAISKTIAIPATVTFEQFAPLYRLAYDSGLKGCTVFRPNPARGHVLSSNANRDCDFPRVPACS